MGPGGTETSYYKTGSSMPHTMLQHDLPHMSHFSSCLLGIMFLSSELQNRHLLWCFYGVFQSYLQCFFLHCAFYLPVGGLCIVYGQLPGSCSLGHLQMLREPTSLWVLTQCQICMLMCLLFMVVLRLSLSLGWRLRSQQLFKQGIQCLELVTRHKYRLGPKMKYKSEIVGGNQQYGA